MKAVILPSRVLLTKGYLLRVLDVEVWNSGPEIGYREFSKVSKVVLDMSHGKNLKE
jgi:hypothetical protein